jgi:hypothetical protein
MEVKDMKELISEVKIRDCAMQRLYVMNMLP